MVDERTLLRMILSTGVSVAWAGALAAGAGLAYGLAVVWPHSRARGASGVFALAVAAHAALLLVEIGSLGLHGGAARLGFGPVLSLTVCLALAVHVWDGRFLTVRAVRRLLALCGLAGVAVGWIFPGEPRVLGSAWAPLHWLLGVASYGLFAVAVLHGVVLDASERRLRMHKASPTSLPGVPLLQLERMTFRFVQAGFAVLTWAILLGVVTTAHWRWDHKTVLSIVSWLIFALLLAGRQGWGWRGRQATRWLYAGTLVLLLAYAGSRFVLEVLLHRSAG
jgi:ABC-type uncharacterized transport system permease subunit